MRAEQYSYWLPAIGWAALILAMSGDTASSGVTEGWIRRVFGHLSHEAVFYINYSLRKGSHVVAYAILGFLNLYGLRYRRAGIALLLAGIVAVIDETHQMSSAVRTGTLTDMGFDVCGAALGVVLTRGWWRSRWGDAAVADAE